MTGLGPRQIANLRSEDARQVCDASFLSTGVLSEADSDFG